MAGLLKDKEQSQRIFFIKFIYVWIQIKASSENKATVLLVSGKKKKKKKETCV